MKVAAVVLNFNDHAATIRCVKSIAASGGVNRVLVVDNGSERADVETLTVALEHEANVELLLEKVNLGFGAGMNRGVAHGLGSGVDAILLLNNDTEVASGAAALLARELINDNNVGIAVPIVTTSDDGRVWAAGGTFDPPTMKVRHIAVGRQPADSPPYDVTFAPGAALLVRAQVLREVGGFVEGLFLYYEDAEFSARVSRAGHKIRVIPDARVWHAVQGGDPNRSMQSIYYRTRNSLWLARELGQRRSVLIPKLAVLAIRLAVSKAGRSPRGFFSATRHVLVGLRDGMRPIVPPDALTPRRFSDTG